MPEGRKPEGAGCPREAKTRESEKPKFIKRKGKEIEKERKNKKAKKCNFIVNIEESVR